MKWKVGLSVLVLGLVFAGLAQASGMFGDSNPKQVLEQRAEELAQKLNNRGAQVAGRGITAGADRARGPRGKRGPRGPRGPQGPAGTFGTLTTVDGPVTTLCTFGSGVCAVGSATAECPAGTTVVSGGFRGLTIDSAVTWNRPVANGWSVIAVNWSEQLTADLRATAVCAS
jgi:hypothetical protein